MKNLAYISDYLTTSQRVAFQSIIEFLQQKREQIFVLTGYAGTGKSYLISTLVEYLKEQELKFICASPTNKATKNLKDMGISATTIAKLLGQFPQLDEELGKEVFVRKESSVEQKETQTIKDYQIVILDEYSMINRETFDELVEEILMSKTKLIFVGDEAQLPPVGEEIPPVTIAQQKWNYPTAHLDEVVRYDGEIGRVAEIIRSNEQYNRRFYPFTTTQDQSIEVLSRTDWTYTAINYFLSEEFAENPDYCRVIAFKNKTCDRANLVIRNKLFPEAKLPFVSGDRLIAKSPLFRWAGGKTKKGQEWDIVCHISEEMIVVNDAQIMPYQLPYEKNGGSYSCYQFPVITDYGSKLKLVVPTEETKLAINKMLETAKKFKNWRLYYNLIKSFDNVGYPYALTTHKAQGSGFDHVFIDISDMRSCTFKQKIVYTALTRAKFKALIRMG